MVRSIWVLVVSVAVCASGAAGQSPDTLAPTSTNAPSKFRSPEDGWLDVSGFLEQKYGFLPVGLPITEPAVGYGAGGGLAFISKPLGEGSDGFGRPNITMIGGLGTENGTWGVAAGDVRHWWDDRVQTVAGIVSASVNLDFHGIGAGGTLADHPLRYNLEPVGGLLQSRYRLGDSRVWAGLSYALASTRVRFDAPAGTPGLPAFQPLDVGNAAQRLLEPAERLRARRMRGPDDHIELQILLVELAPHLEAATDIEPAQPVHVIHAEGASRRPGEERGGRALAHPVVGDRVPAVDHLLVGRVEHLEGRHDLPSGHRLDLDLALRELVDALGGDAEVILQRVARRPGRLHLD